MMCWKENLVKVVCDIDCFVEFLFVVYDVFYVRVG